MNQSSESAELSFEEKVALLRIKVNEDGLYWCSSTGLWVDKDTLIREWEHMKKYRAIMGDSNDVTALNYYEKSMGL